MVVENLGEMVHEMLTQMVNEILGQILDCFTIVGMPTNVECNGG